MCPRCKRDHDILNYKRMGEIEAHLGETVPIYKCRSCTWLFAPVDVDVRNFIQNVRVGVRDAE